MAQKLEKLLEKIHPSKSIDQFEKRISRALNDFNWSSNTVDSMDESEECIIEFTMLANLKLHKMEKENSNKNKKMSRWIAFDLLKKEFPRYTENSIYEIMSSGAEGGVYGIVKTLADLLYKDSAQGYINSRVNDYLKSRNMEQKFKDINEYKRMYEDILPADSSIDPVNFKEVLQQHPWIIKRRRDRG